MKPVQLDRFIYGTGLPALICRSKKNEKKVMKLAIVLVNYISRYRYHIFLERTRTYSFKTKK
jgi:hypothetical protein